MSDKNSFNIITIVKDDPITGVEYGPVEMPCKILSQHELDTRMQTLYAIKAKRMRAEKQKQK